MNAKTCRLLALILQACCGLRAMAETEIVYPAPESPRDVRHADILELLNGALAHTDKRYGPALARPSLEPMNKNRQLLSLTQGQGLTLMWGSISRELQQKTLPVYIPLRKGLLGYRIALIRRDRQDEFNRTASLADLKKFSLGQGRGWADVDILRGAGFHVITNEYPQLFGMIEARRIDLFPRGINEVYAEYAAHRDQTPSLAVEAHLALHYANPYYFYVAKDNAALAQRLEQGLRLMMRDGSFDEIFWRYNGQAIRQADLAHRGIIEIPSDDTLTPRKVLKDSQLWFDPRGAAYR
ncbi:transporter substrate-binding domain-containing protein [Chromobacterium subtsugae]|uniref:Transporter substrate-binding domain-containing protein n=1 Tax=Chromobacterium subtsugae TaxID=251747 RepID=A0ABS7F9P2_9NEIS|nr:MULTISPECIES: transporter substrate-binding domain-containing protein [Chromobacterium]MBW7565337.1 transporter substrate-binding domain-containing protein [Chromobacterium subtsugae]MBW8286812.1 transporter substrate-binding domain-containing protein [Chromobacterium subtsugae]OBU86195.1 hypothetical protein MY55_12420 [Chromobacterium subtsugae]WSE90711.1 transporter substrate-binding domain-containing protein [Chromobacterium subtsugae]WVH59084.1 transporter substrate-binding domain-cont